MININNENNENNKIIYYLYSFLFLSYAAIFILEVIYYLPSATGDDLWFLKLSFNICRDDSFVVTSTSIYKYNAETLNFTRHGWFGPYLQGKLNYNCSLKGLFLFSFFIKLATSFFLFLYFNSIKFNKIYSFIIILATLLVQLKIQFRIETFTILLYSVLFYFFIKKNYLISGILFSLIFFSQPTLFGIIGIIGFLTFFQEIKKNLLFLILGFLIGFFLLLYIYPYTFVEYLAGLWDHRQAYNNQTLLVGGLNKEYIYNLFQYYIIDPFYPFLAIIILSLLFVIIKNKPILSLSLPVLFYFGPNIPSSNYVLISLVPFLILIYLSLLRNSSKIKLPNNKLYLIILLISFLGFTQYFSRNTLTAIKYSNQFNITKEFLLSNINVIEQFPGFAFMLDDKFKFISMGEKKERSQSYKYKILSVNGSINPCPNSQHNELKQQGISIFSFKIFNSNSGYGMWVCNSKK
jgi:hypothetical protein